MIAVITKYDDYRHINLKIQIVCKILIQNQPKSLHVGKLLILPYYQTRRVIFKRSIKVVTNMIADDKKYKY